MHKGGIMKTSGIVRRFLETFLFLATVLLAAVLKVFYTQEFENTIAFVAYFFILTSWFCLCLAMVFGHNEQVLDKLRKIKTNCKLSSAKLMDIRDKLDTIDIDNQCKAVAVFLIALYTYGFVLYQEQLSAVEIWLRMIFWGAGGLMMYSKFYSYLKKLNYCKVKNEPLLKLFEN